MPRLNVHTDPILNYVNSRAGQFLEDLCRLIRQPSVSSTGFGISECANLVCSMAVAAGFVARVIHTEQYPRVFGEFSVDTQLPTLLITSHYDVQPPEPLEKWDCDPFSATHTSDDRIIGRGATDAKGNLVAILKAVEALRATRSRLPLNIKVLFDGEEEIGSPSLPGFLDRNKQSLACDAVLTVDAGFEPIGRPFIWLGAGGMLSIEMIVQTGDKEVHSDSARLVPNAVWRLVWALAMLKDGSEHVLVPGFYRRVLPPTPGEEALLRQMPWDDSPHKATLGVDRFLLGTGGLSALKRLLYEPTCTITGITGGYVGEGVKEAVPNRALGKVEFRLVMDQDPDEIEDLLVEYLRKAGFDDVRIRALAKTEPSQCSLNSRLRRALERSAKNTYGMDPVTRPRHASSGRQATWIARRLGVEGALTGIGPPNWNGHAPNEFITVGHFLRGVRFIADAVEQFAME